MLKPVELHLTQEWDKTFPKSDRVDHKKVTFINRYGITLLSTAMASPWRRTSIRRKTPPESWRQSPCADPLGR